MKTRPSDPGLRWFAERGWRPFAFQRELWRAAAAGESGLLHAGTGTGKTYAAWFAAIRRGLLMVPPAGASLRVLWITPTRALAADTVAALQVPAANLAPGWEVGLRTGDTSAAQRRRQALRLPAALVTTPESLSLMLSRASAATELAGLAMVVVDEWHELVGNKRGVQVQLALARLRRWNPGLVVWGLSATLGNLDEAMDALTGYDPGRPISPRGRLVRGKVPKGLRIDTLMPEETGRFPWGGHLGLQMIEPVVREIEAGASTLVFTNTRSQAELWYQALLERRPDWAGVIALHHGSLDREVREWVEAGLKSGLLKAVVCTSSLDLGVDFSPVTRVLQIGSAKGVARLLQRAGRSGHSPGQVSRLSPVPTNALELIESAAAQDAVAAGHIEPRWSPNKPLDVLAQHLVTVAAGPGFVASELFDEVRATRAYRELTEAEWQWVLDFVTRGGASLAVYPEFRRVQPDAQGVYRVPDEHLARRHRMSIGTIVSDTAMQVAFSTGQKLGSIEESFIGRLKPGDRFLFGGRVLELIRVRELTAWVRRASSARGAVPRWNGGRMSLSGELADAMLQRLAMAQAGRFEGPEMKMARPLLELQARWSALPVPGRLLVERLKSREGHHCFVYPFAGRQVHVGLASLLCWRLAREQAGTFSIAVNDCGFELLCADEIAPQAWHDKSLFEDGDLLADVLASLDAGELAQRRFREIARIAGLVFQGFPGAHKSARQVQASSGLFFEVFRQHDAGNLLLAQAQREVLEQELELGRLRAVLARMRDAALQVIAPARATPFAFPLMVERLRETLSTEKLGDRIARMVAELERAGQDD
ncbi:MAG: ligase-associated DNA damage response DEXH box helicase [Burkholderiaceae bacterium]|nr:ligase-associated DNA damage response DEXH box helicase [Burkholderiaceae bacterium]